MVSLTKVYIKSSTKEIEAESVSLIRLGANVGVGTGWLLLLPKENIYFFAAIFVFPRHMS